MNVQRPTFRLRQGYGGQANIERRKAPGGAGKGFVGRWALAVGCWVFRISLGVWVFGCLGICGAAEQAAPIPQDTIEALQAELEAGTRSGASSVEVRRTCKNVIRNIELVLEKSPDAPNRFAVLDLLFEGQRRLLILEATDKNRETVFETAEKLAAAPDEYMEARLEADLLLSERDLAEADATVAERVKALEDIMAKYRGTPAERLSLTIASRIAAKLQAFDIQKKIYDKLTEGSFGGDSRAIAFRRRTRNVRNLDAVFSGTFESTDGASITFPSDRLGHQYLVLFWSRSSRKCEEFLGDVKEQQERFPGRFEIYSFNLDKLPDAGLKILQKAGIRCTAMHLPGGKTSDAYNAFGVTDPVAIFANAQGHVELVWGRVIPWSKGTPARGKVPANPGPGLGKWLDDERYLAQMRSLFIGDFLVPDLSAVALAKADLASRSKAIQSCFTPPPFRYRLTRDQELANYRKAEKLCADAIRRSPKASGLSAIRSRRIIALLGMYNLAREPKYLAEAVKEARTTLTMGVPPGGDVVARFCLAKGALRSAAPHAVEGILSGLLEESGGDKAPAPAVAASAILSIEANAETLYHKYRKRFLAMTDDDDSSLWPVASFMRDRNHDYRLFWANPGRWGYTRKQRYKVRQLIAGFLGPATPARVLTAALKNLDGEELKIPEVANGKMMGLLFVEPSRDKPVRDNCVKWLKDFAGRFSKRGIPVVAAFLSDDVKTVQAIVQECAGSFRAAMVPGGLEHPLVRQLGILRADELPNPFLLLGDGTVAWWASGLTHEVEHTAVEIYTATAIGANIEKIRTDRAFEPLQQGDFKKALLLLDERIPPKMGSDAWTADRRQGRALAHMGLNDSEAALKEIDAAIAELMRVSRHGGRVHRGSIEMLHVRATVLGKLGRAEESKSVRAQAEKEAVWLKTAPYFHPPSFARNGVPVGVYTELLKKVRLKLEGRDK